MIYGRGRISSELPCRRFLILAEIPVRFRIMITLSMEHSIKTNQDPQRPPQSLYSLDKKKENSLEKAISLLT
jgi:hypothetical protein